MDIDRIINEHLDKVNEEENRKLVQEFEEVYNSLEESPKSQLVRILLGTGAMEKTKDGKLKVVDSAKADKIRKDFTSKK